MHEYNVEIKGGRSGNYNVVMMSAVNYIVDLEGLRTGIILLRGI